ncbi:MAG: 16S rRNA (uracil(1498)-N(3))-methyltransferase [Bacteroidales bacterium]|nr:16S rRNA (uracil(1498)-N(3))-methyltransferase [Bacteroidales bacterium]
MNLFYHSALHTGFLNSSIQLDTEESYHCIKVLRKRIGDTIHVTDGHGNLYVCSLADENHKGCQITVLSFTEQEKRAFRLHIAIAPTKNIDRFEWFLEKTTEIGIDEITPLICEHSERTVVRTDRLQKILVSAMKQSMNLYLPKLNEPCKFNQFIHQEYTGQKFIGYVEEKQEILLKDAYQKGSDAIILIGPEGDFSPAEVKHSVESGFSAISLGPSRLRTETAGMVACMTVNHANL